MMIYFKMSFKVPYFLSDYAAFAKRYCKNKQNTNVKHELNIENDGRL